MAGNEPVLQCATGNQEAWGGGGRQWGSRGRAEPAFLPGSSFGTEIFFLLRTALKDRPKGPSTANHQPPPTANRQLPPTASGDQPPTANHC